MSIALPIDSLPTDIDTADAVQTVYREDLDWVEKRIRAKMSVLIECEAGLKGHLLMELRSRLRKNGKNGAFKVKIINGQKGESSLFRNMMNEIHDAVCGYEENTVIVINQIDLLSTHTRSSLTDIAKELIATVYDNPEVIVLGFKDPSFALPEPITKLFAASRSFLGIPREKIGQLLTRRQARKFGVKEINPVELYKYVSGMTAPNFVNMMGFFEDHVDFDPANPQSRAQIFSEIREITLGKDLEIPNIRLDRDIGGYEGVKNQIHAEILDLYQQRENPKNSKEDVRRIEKLLPKGIIFEGPPGTGKTLFAKAIATELDAAAFVVSGPELKSKWVGESEENIRKVFARARKAAPAIIIFDELDSFASKRDGGLSTNGVQHSMVNQLLTEMDGFQSDELVFVVGTTNFANSLDHALLRPGRFEMVMEIGYPDSTARQAIIDVYDKKFNLSMTKKVKAHLTQITGGLSDPKRKTRFSGDHINAICRALARDQIRQGKHKITVEEIDEVVGYVHGVAQPTKDELEVICIHEAGHAVAAMVQEDSQNPEVISIQGVEGTNVGGFVQQGQMSEIMQSQEELEAQLVVLVAGRAAERKHLDKVSTGAANDLEKAHFLARLMVVECSFYDIKTDGKNMSQAMSQKVEDKVQSLIAEAEEKAEELLDSYDDLFEAVSEALAEHKTLDEDQIKRIKKKAHVA